MPANAHTHAPRGHSHEGYAAREHPEFVALDIGGELGALIVETDARMHGLEIEIARQERDARRTHKQVLARYNGRRRAYTLVFDALREGRYTLWLEDRALATDVEVCGGEVTKLDWRGRRA
jgi:hypothetical protein